MKWLFMDSEARLVPPRPRWREVAVLARGKAFPTSPGPLQQGTLTAMSGHITTTSDQYGEVLGTRFNPDAAPSSADMITDLVPAKEYSTCRLTKAF
jgi:hypothetical protein